MSRFTEFFVDELTEKSDLTLLVGTYLRDLSLPSVKIENLVRFYLNIRKEAAVKLADGTGHTPHYRCVIILCVAEQFPLSHEAELGPCDGANRRYLAGS
jgi:hypothetical protein